MSKVEFANHFTRHLFLRRASTAKHCEDKNCLRAADILIQFISPRAALVAQPTFIVNCTF